MEEQEYEVEFKTERTANDRLVQTLYFVDGNEDHTRDVHMSTDQALEQLRERFDFRSGRHYLITYLTNYQWRSGRPFTYIARRTNLSEHVYSVEQEIENYGREQALDPENLHVYAIQVKQMA